MPRRKFFVSETNPYHIYGRCLNKQWFDVPMPIVWRVMCDYLFFIHHAYSINIYSFVLMQNHFHMMARSPEGSLSLAMQYFMNQTSKALAKESNRINQIWGSRYGRCEVVGSHHALSLYKYIYRNPVRPGMVTRVEDYPFSSLHGLLGRSQIWIPLVEDTILFSDCEGTLKWLNTPSLPDHHRAFQLALRRRVFRLPRIDKRLHPLENDTL